MAKTVRRNDKYKWFFDRKIVINAVDRATHKNLSKLGAFVMTGARRSIRKRKKVSQPGKPPSSHVGLLRSRILFEYNPNKKIVVVGPEKISVKSLDKSGKVVRGTVPAVLEFGGAVYYRQVFRNGRWTTTYGSLSPFAKLTSRLKQVKISARPYMRPALKESLGKIKQVWKNSVKARY